MTTNKHTQGEWVYLDIGEVVVQGDIEVTIATIDYARERADEDGALIAAAPELLSAAELAMEGIEVLDLLIASIEMHGNYSVENTLWFLNQARCARLRLTEAISKATHP